MDALLFPAKNVGFSLPLWHYLLYTCGMEVNRDHAPAKLYIFGGTIMIKKILSLVLVVASLVGLLCIPASAAGQTAIPTSSTVLVNGNNIKFDAYNIDGSNYFKLRDVAYVINGTTKQFDVAWDSANNAIKLTSGAMYTTVGGEMAGKGSGNKTAEPTDSKMYIDGKAVSFTSYNIDGNNYFKLRDIGQVFNFGVDWDGAKNTIAVSTIKDYVSEGYVATSAKTLDYYNLTDTEKMIYDRLVEGIANFEIEVVSGHVCDIDSLQNIYAVALFANPEFFWFKSLRHGENADGEHCLWPSYVAGEVTIAAGRTTSGALSYPSQSTVDVGKAWVEEAKKTVSLAMTDVPVYSGMTPYEFEVAVHDWICNNFTFATGDTSSRSIYQALTEGTANSTDVTRLFQYIMRLNGIECLTIYGASSNSYSTRWNAVKLDGQWYLVDVTRDMGITDRDKEIWHFFLNRTDKFFTDRGYTPGREGFSVPNISCTATKYDYYQMNNASISSDSDFISKVPALIEKARASGARAFDMEFTPEYVEPKDVVTKKLLIDESYWSDISFTWNPLGPVWGIFK